MQAQPLAMLLITFAKYYTATNQQNFINLSIEKLKVRKIDANHTQFSGILLNQNDKSIELPNLKLIFATEPDKTEEIILTPQQYLVENLRGIQRIPSNTPFRFQFELNKSKKG